ncbi:TonB-dependent siderophore receptor [Neokomagataea tanensis]|uniref:TonB-dependent siderophore receptor n=2 Tax=Neokomagataea TaxID=1223423 RepID=A0A4Y6V902_9PROT|nr:MULTISPECIES: TonB-dependent siderophore receptor [Neokomagataea]QDH25368.1 TonB-dependent siderophore receptor [Neokomagataea tanensis]
MRLRFALLMGSILCSQHIHAETKTTKKNSEKSQHSAENITVHGTRSSLLATSSSSATKTHTPLELTAQNITVITQARMSMLNSRSLSEAVRYSAGVSDYGSKDDPRGYFGTIRGFTPDIYLDGTRTPNAATAQSLAIEPWGLEEMDVLRGATAALYGSGQLGGIINAVSKRPHLQQKDTIAIQTGSYGRIQGATDIGGTLNKDHTLLWRFNGLVRKSDTYAKHILNNEIFVAPSLRWTPNRSTDFTFLSSFEQLDAGSTAQFLPAQGTLLPSRWGQISKSMLTSDAAYDVYSKRQVTVGYALRHEFAPGWSINQNMRYAHLDLLYRFVTTNALSSDQRSITRQALLQSGNYNTVTLDTHAEGHVLTGPVKHTLLFGVDFRSDFTALRRGQATAPSLDLYNPVYRQITWPTYASRINTNATATQTGLYAQDQIDWKNFYLTVSGREDFTQSLTVDNNATKNASTNQKNNAFTGRASLLYKTPFGLSPYAAYSTSFQPQIGVTRLNTAFVPTRGRQVEAGIKYATPSNARWGNLLITADVFNLVEKNELMSDPVDSTYSIQVGQQRSRGLELEAVGRIPGAVDIIASFTTQSTTITHSSVAAQIGQRPVAVPAHMASLFVKRDVQLTPAWKAGLGSGFRYTGNTAGSLPATFNVPSQLVWDMEAHADYRNYRVQLNGTNMANRKYVAMCTRSVACSWAPGRAMFVTLSAGF